MKSIDEIFVDKIFELVNYALSKFIKPDIELDKITQLDDRLIAEIKDKHGIEGLILDIDETLRTEMKAIPKCNEGWLDKVKQQFKVIVVSNGIDKNIEDFLKKKGIDYISFAHKPLKKSFIKACKQLDIQPEKVLVLGDGLWADIYGGKRNNMKTARVKGVDR